MNVTFIKAQALGNDFVIIEMPPFPTAQIKHIADRRRGVGCDQLVFFQRCSSGALFNVQFYNADGSEAEACGNGSRALITLLGQGMPQPFSATLRTKTRNVACSYFNGSATLHMGTAAIGKVEAPLLCGQLGEWGAVDIGNPHLIAFVDNLDQVDITSMGAGLEHHSAFPRRTNVSFAELKTDRILLKTWERGAGYTGACGTGACATAALAYARGLIDGAVTVSQSGGDVRVTPSPTDIQLSGPATIVFKGEINLGSIPGGTEPE